LSTLYTGSLVSILAVDVYPRPAQSMDELAEIVQREDLGVGLCCKVVDEAMRESERESLKMLQERVRNIIASCN